MRFSRLRILALGLALVGLGWAAGRKRATTVGEVASEPAMFDPARPSEGPRGWRLVAAAFAMCALLAAAYLAWQAERKHSEQVQIAIAMTAGDPSRAPSLITRFGCGGCHAIPGAPGADGKVGPDLAGLRQRVYIGGVARNTAQNLVDWIVNPQRFSPRSAMPATGINDAQARDIAAYLYAR